MRRGGRQEQAVLGLLCNGLRHFFRAPLRMGLAVG
jgi:hypothetical protein